MNGDVSVSPVLSSSGFVSSVPERQGVSAQDARGAGSEGAGPRGGHPGLVLLEAGVEEGVTLIPGRAALAAAAAAAGLQVAAVSGLQEAVRVVEVTDLELEHPGGAHSLDRERGQKVER